MTALSNQERIRIGFEKIDSDLNFLMTCFRDVLIELGDEDIARHLPWIGETPPNGEDAMHPGMIQAISISFQLLNMVEENAANQMRRRSEADNGPLNEPGLWGNYLQRLKEAGWTQEQVADALPYLRVEPVLTAHPTESKRVTVLEQHRELYLLLVHLENRMWTPNERDLIEEQIKAALERLWRTGETLFSKPSVAAERSSLLHYFDNVFPEILYQVDRHLEEAWIANGWDPQLVLNSSSRPRLRFGTWVGGDRDGHPLVTAEVTRESLLDYRTHALRLQHRKLSELRSRLSLSARLQEPPPGLIEKLEEMASQIGDDATAILERNSEEPWRQYLSLLITRLPPPDFDPSDSRQPVGRYYRYSFNLSEDLRILRDSLLEIGATRIARRDVDPVLRIIEIFGFHLAALDVRQNSAFHEKAIAQILHRAGMKDHDYPSWSEEKKLAFLDEQLESPVPLLPPGETPGGEAEAVISAHREVARTIERHGDEGIGSFILSMTRSASDLLAVYFLAREAALLRKLDTGVICLVPVVPLLETLEDLENGPAILETFLSHPVTRNSLDWLHRRGGLLAKKGGISDTDALSSFDSLRLPVQQVMIGYSDSNKDSGILASQWGLFQAQQKISALAGSLGFRIRFFHGRGGTISRGAGPTHRFLEALPPEALSFDLRATEQGETIAQKFANHLTATHNLDLLISGTFYHSLSSEKKKRPREECREAIAKLARESSEVYRAFLREPNFMEFYTDATPLDALEKSSIGSRPARRTGARTLDDLRAIPWVFSWSQSRFFLPGWYGFGSGIERLSDSEKEAILEGLHGWPFLRYVFTNVETSLSSTDGPIMSAYAELVRDKKIRDHFMDLVEKERRKTKVFLTEWFGSEQKVRRPRLDKTVQPRNRALEPIHHQQIQLLKRLRNGAISPVDEKELTGHLLLTINAISSGLRTTG